MHGEFSRSLIKDYQRQFTSLLPSALNDNYFSDSFGGKFFNADDAKTIGYIRGRLKNDCLELAVS
jgi:adenine-specific DNA-methyltransferase